VRILLLLPEVRVTRYQAGRRKEWACRKTLAKFAQLTIRAAGSKGLVDVIAVYQNCIYAVQVKFVKPGASWRDANWRKLLSLKVPANVKRLAYVYRRGTTEPEVHTS
jgi:hypothetical protein